MRPEDSAMPAYLLTATSVPRWSMRSTKISLTRPSYQVPAMSRWPAVWLSCGKAKGCQRHSTRPPATGHQQQAPKIASGFQQVAERKGGGGAGDDDAGFLKAHAGGGGGRSERHARFGKDQLIDEHDVGHRHKNRQAGEDFRAPVCAQAAEFELLFEGAAQEVGTRHSAPPKILVKSRIRPKNPYNALPHRRRPYSRYPRTSFPG